jgi:hypothetical protein
VCHAVLGDVANPRLKFPIRVNGVARTRTVTLMDAHYGVSSDIWSTNRNGKAFRSEAFCGAPTHEHRFV